MKRREMAKERLKLLAEREWDVPAIRERFEKLMKQVSGLCGCAPFAHLSSVPTYSNKDAWACLKMQRYS